MREAFWAFRLMEQDDKLRILTTFQHWLGTNYSNLPTDSGNMTERARKFLDENQDIFERMFGINLISK